MRRVEVYVSGELSLGRYPKELSELHSMPEKILPHTVDVCSITVDAVWYDLSLLSHLAQAIRHLGTKYARVELTFTRLTAC
jgi:hypothetical protein